MAVELKHGVVSGLRTEGEKTKGGVRCKAIFKLNGRPAEYVYGTAGWDDGLLEAPFENGGHVFAAGRQKSKRNFVIYAMRCPPDNQIYCASYIPFSVNILLIFTSLFPIAISIFMLFQKINIKDKIFIAASTALPLFTLFLIIQTMRDISQARDLVS